MRIWPALLLSLCLLALLLLAQGTELAQAYLQATVTATFVPMFPTSTQVDSFNLNCPTALPVGWGTVTPGLLWNSSCGNCQLTLTPQPSATPGGPPGTSEGIRLTFIPQLGESQSNGDMHFDIPIAPEHRGYVVGWVDHYYSIGSRARQYAVYGPDDGFGPFLFSGIIINAGDEVVSWSGNVLTLGVSTGERDEFMAEWTQFDAQQGSGPFGVFYPPLMAARIARTRNAGLGPGSESQVGIIGYIIDGEAINVSPVSTYCGEVNGQNASLESFELGIELPEFGIGASSCYGIAEIIIPTSIINFFPGINIDDVTMPGIQICFVEISFGTLDLFGVSVNLDSIANLLAAALIIRWLLRS